MTEKFKGIKYHCRALLTILNVIVEEYLDKIKEYTIKLNYNGVSLPHHC